jgi:hypothetical protein
MHRHYFNCRRYSSVATIDMGNDTILIIVSWGATPNNRVPVHQTARHYKPGGYAERLNPQLYHHIDSCRQTWFRNLFYPEDRCNKFSLNAGNDPSNYTVLHFIGRQFLKSISAIFSSSPNTAHTKQTNSVSLVRKRTISTKRSRLSAKLVPTFADREVSRSQRGVYPTAVISVF